MIKNAQLLWKWHDFGNDCFMRCGKWKDLTISLGPRFAVFFSETYFEVVAIPFSDYITLFEVSSIDLRIFEVSIAKKFAWGSIRYKFNVIDCNSFPIFTLTFKSQQILTSRSNDRYLEFIQLPVMSNNVEHLSIPGNLSQGYFQLSIGCSYKIELQNKLVSFYSKIFVEQNTLRNRVMLFWTE